MTIRIFIRAEFNHNPAPGVHKGAATARKLLSVELRDAWRSLISRIEVVLPLTEECMRRIGIALLAAVAASLSAAAQIATSQPQSPRQALIEMFTGKGENDFTKHLPSATLAALVRKGETPDT